MKFLIGYSHTCLSFKSKVLVRITDQICFSPDKGVSLFGLGLGRIH